MTAIYDPIRGYFKGYEFRNNQMTPQWGTQEYNFTLAIFVDAQEALDEAKKHNAIAYSINQLPV